MPYFESGDDREIKVDLMLKRSQGKKKILTAVNYKERVFVLTPKQLQYYEGTKEVNCSYFSIVFYCNKLRLYLIKPFTDFLFSPVYLIWGCIYSLASFKRIIRPNSCTAVCWYA